MKTKSNKTRAILMAMVFLTISSLFHSKSYANEWVDPGTQEEQMDRRSRFERNPEGTMKVLNELKNSGYARTAYRSAKLYLDSGVSDFRLRDFVNSQDYNSLTDR